MNTLIRKLKPLALLLSFALVGTVNANDWPAAGRPIQLTVPSPGGGRHWRHHCKIAGRTTCYQFENQFCD
jgi:hypothetical protein